jgi:hypothetical protein
MTMGPDLIPNRMEIHGTLRSCGAGILPACWMKGGRYDFPLVYGYLGLSGICRHHHGPEGGLIHLMQHQAVFCRDAQGPRTIQHDPEATTPVGDSCIWNGDAMDGARLPFITKTFWVLDHD